MEVWLCWDQTFGSPFDSKLFPMYQELCLCFLAWAKLKFLILSKPRSFLFPAESWRSSSCVWDGVACSLLDSRAMGSGAGSSGPFWHDQISPVISLCQIPVSRGLWRNLWEPSVHCAWKVGQTGFQPLASTDTSKCHSAFLCLWSPLFSPARLQERFEFYVLFSRIRCSQVGVEQMSCCSSLWVHTAAGEESCEMLPPSSWSPSRGTLGSPSPPGVWWGLPHLCQI